jgi:hypothetical protein
MPISSMMRGRLMRSCAPPGLARRDRPPAGRGRGHPKRAGRGGGRAPRPAGARGRRRKGGRRDAEQGLQPGQVAQGGVIPPPGTQLPQVGGRDGGLRRVGQAPDCLGRLAVGVLPALGPVRGDHGLGAGGGARPGGGPGAGQRRAGPSGAGPTGRPSPARARAGRLFHSGQRRHGRRRAAAARRHGSDLRDLAAGPGGR